MQFFNKNHFYFFKLFAALQIRSSRPSSDEDEDNQYSDASDGNSSDETYSPSESERDSSESERDDEDDDITDDEDVIKDTDFPQIYTKKVTKSSTTKTGKKKKFDRRYDVKHFCPYCKKLVINFCQHISSKQHSTEPEMIQIHNAKKAAGNDTGKCKNQTRLITLFRNKSDNYHNCKVIKKKSGEMIIGRRLTKGPFSIKDYGPCPGCLEWLRLTMLRRHQQNCPSSTNVPLTIGDLMVQSNVISGRIECNPSTKMLAEVYPTMKSDHIGDVAKSDGLIVLLGNQWFIRNIGNPLMRRYYVSAIMRLCARLLIALRKMVIPSTGIRMEDYLVPAYFQHVARAALKVANQDDMDEENLRAPSSALKLSYDIKRLLDIKVGVAIKTGNKQMREEADDFLTLMKIEWSTKLERELLEERKAEKTRPMPLPSDVKTLAAFYKKESEEMDLKNSSYDNFKRAGLIALASLVVYNRHRPGGVQAMK